MGNKTSYTQIEQTKGMHAYFVKTERLSDIKEISIQPKNYPEYPGE